MSVRSINVGLSGSLWYLDLDSFRPFMSQKLFIEFSSMPTLKSSMEKNELIISFAMLINDAV